MEMEVGYCMFSLQFSSSHALYSYVYSLLLLLLGICNNLQILLAQCGLNAIQGGYTNTLYGICGTVNFVDVDDWERQREVVYNIILQCFMEA